MLRKLTRNIAFPDSIEHGLDAALDKAMQVERPVVQAYLNRVRARRPYATPAMVVELLEKHYQAAAVGIGAASGGTAAIPTVGTVASLATGAAEIAAFVSATAMYVLALAELHSVPVGDPEVRRALVLGVLVGSAGTAAIESAEGVGRVAGVHWAKVIYRPDTAGRIEQLNNRLGRLLLTRWGTRQGALVVGRALPMGIGAGVGAAGNAALARGCIRTARKAFGPAPARFPGRVVDVGPSAIGPGEAGTTG